MKLLEAHGITLLPEDSGGTGNLLGNQSLTLTEAGKLALSSSAPSSPVVTTTIPSFTLHNKTVSHSKSASTQKFVAVSSKPAANIQTTKSIVINTSSPSSGTAEPVKKAPRVIRVTPQQFAALKANKGSPFKTAAAANKAVKIEPAGVKTAAGKTIKIVRLNPPAASNVQILPKPTILASKSPSVVSGTPDKNALIQKQLKEIQDAREALNRKEDELFRQLGGSS